MSGLVPQDRYLRTDGQIYITGIQALVRLLCDRIRLDRQVGLNTAAFVSGYEGSPLAGFDIELSRRASLLAAHDVVHRPAVNEELAATSVMGSQLVAATGQARHDGVSGFWYGKSPGLDRAGDAFRHANLVGTAPRGGALALVGDDPVAKSSSAPSASELALADLSVPVFFPADSQDILDLGRHAVQLSRASGLWAAMKIVSNVADAAATATLHPGWEPPELDSEHAYRHRPSGHLLGANLAELERSLHTVRLPLATAYLRASGVNQITLGDADARIGIVAAGKSYLDVRQALVTLGLDDAALARYGIKVLKLGAIHPMEPDIVRQFAAGLAEIVVVEEKRSFVETAVKEILYGRTGAPPVHGKTGPDGSTLFSSVGELDPDVIAAGLARRLLTHGEIEPVRRWAERRPRERTVLPLLAAPSRTPYFCSGCPHNSSIKVPDGTLVGAGIGCHIMAVLMEPEQAGDIIGLTQMGGEGAQWVGMAPFTDVGHFTQNMGDGTFTHSGSLAVRAAVAAGVNITFKLLYNSAVAMTGGQEAVGALPVGRVAGLLLLEGVAKVVITSDDPRRARRQSLPAGVEVRHRDELVRTQRELAAVPGVTVLIHDQECATELRRKRRRGEIATPATRVLINERVCEGCGDCGARSNCLSVEPVATEFGRKTKIQQSSCNVDYSCLSGDCPAFVTVTPRRLNKVPAPTVMPPLAKLPDPERRVASGDFTVRIIGVGGAGVVTAAQIIATAAVLDGRQARVLDQTGLSQKGGAVVSDIKITTSIVPQAAKLAAGECDLYLVCDPLSGVNPVMLAAADPSRTIAVASTAQVPTGRMVTNTAVRLPDWEHFRSAIAAASADALFLDSLGLAESLLHDVQFANILQLGAAYQYGALPISAHALESAIELNGVAVDRNIAAFRHGRHVVALPAGSAAVSAPAGTAQAPARGGTDHGTTAAARVQGAVAAEPGSELARLLAVRVPDLIAYQNEGYAREYAEFVEQVRRIESDAEGKADVAIAVARHLHKLMAYKDEYEVARLSLDNALTAEIEAAFGPGARYAYRFHPPALRALGMKRKIALGRWVRPALRLLYAMRALRGTAFDPFGRTQVRRVERALPAEYRAAILAALTASPAVDQTTAGEIAELPDMIRGYEDLKLANVAAYCTRLSELVNRLHAPVGAGLRSGDG